MKNILKVIAHDFRRLTSSVVALVILMGIIVVPCLFAWFNILSNWDPFQPESTGRIPVAVVSEDEGAEMLGMKVNVGEKFLDVVNGNDMIGWDTSVNKKQAIKGVRAGDYYAAVILPEDFSGRMLSFASGQMQHPKILFYENEKKNAISPKITGTISEVLKQEIDKTFVATVGQYITEAATAAKEAGLEPEAVFGDLSSRLRDLSSELDSSISMVKAAAGLSDAAGDLLTASDELIQSSEGTIELGEEMLKSAEDRIPEKADTSSIEKTIHDITSLLSKDLSKISGDLSSVRNDMNKYNKFVQKDLARHQKLVSSMKKSTDSAASKLKSLGLTGLASRFQRISDKLSNMSDRLSRFEKADETNWSVIQGYIDEVLSDIEFSNGSIAQIEADVNAKLDMKLDQAVKNARSAISGTRKSLSGIYGDMDLLEDVLSSSDKALKSLDGGFAGTASVLVSLQDGSRNLAGLFDTLSDSDILKDVNHLMTNDAEVIAANMAAPIKMKTEKVYPIKTFGSVMTPFYNAIALWVGILFAAIIIRVQVKRKTELEQIKLHEAFFGRYRLFLMIGLSQALLLSIGELLYLGIQCLHPLLFILAACVTSVAFSMIIYSLVFAFESIGLAVSVVAMILQVAGAGGTFPSEVLPPVFRAMYPFMPFRYAMDAMRDCIGGMYENTYIKCLGILLLFGLCLIAVGLLMHKPMRGVIEKVEESKAKSDIML